MFGREGKGCEEVIPYRKESTDSSVNFPEKNFKKVFSRKTILLLVLVLIGFTLLENRGFIVGEFTIARHKKITTYLDEGYRSYYDINAQFIVLNEKLHTPSDPLTNFEILNAQKELNVAKENLTAIRVPKEFEAFHMSIQDVLETLEEYSIALERNVTLDRNNMQEINSLIAEWNIQNGVAKKLLRQACVDANIDYKETETGFEYRYFTHGQTDGIQR